MLGVAWSGFDRGLERASSVQRSCSWRAAGMLQTCAMQLMCDPTRAGCRCRNLAVGGSWPGNPTAATPFPATMAVQYVRVWATPADATAR